GARRGRGALPAHHAGGHVVRRGRRVRALRSDAPARPADADRASRRRGAGRRDRARGANGPGTRRRRRSRGREIVNGARLSVPGAATVRSPIAPMYLEPFVRSTQVSQRLCGHEVELLEVQDEWYRVRGADGYEGWIHWGFLS